MHNDFDADDLRIIFHIAQGLNMSLVSKKLGITPQRVSQRISRMESICRTTLIYRKGGLHLTPAGEKLLVLARNVENEVATFKQNLANLRSNHGQLRIIGVNSLILDYIPTVVKRVVKEYSNLRLKIMTGTADQVVDTVARGQADVGLLGMNRQVEGLVFHSFKRERLCLLASNAHPISTFDSVFFCNAAQYDFIDIDSENFMSTLLIAAEMRSKNHLNRVMKASCLEVAAQFASQGFGICLTLASVAKRHTRSNNCKAIMLKDNWAISELVCCAKQIPRQPPALSYFLSELRKENTTNDDPELHHENRSHE